MNRFDEQPFHELIGKIVRDPNLRTLVAGTLAGGGDKPGLKRVLQQAGFSLTDDELSAVIDARAKIAAHLTSINTANSATKPAMGVNKTSADYDVEVPW